MRREGGGREEGGRKEGLEAIQLLYILYIFTWEVERRFASRAYYYDITLYVVTMVLVASLLAPIPTNALT